MIMWKSGRSNPGDTAGEMTELVFILDRSGSMSGLVDDTIRGFNKMIAKQKEEPGRAVVTTVLFNNEMSVLMRRKPLESVGKMTRRQYRVDGCTALLDAVGTTIARVNNDQKAEPDGRPDHTVFVITTDGYENASTRYTAEKVRKMIEKRKRKNGWEFIFLGANIDAIAAAGSIGIAPECAARYAASPDGTQRAYSAVGSALSSVRRSGRVSSSWKRGVNGS